MVLRVVLVLGDGNIKISLKVLILCIISRLHLSIIETYSQIGQGFPLLGQTIVGHYQNLPKFFNDAYSSRSSHVTIEIDSTGFGSYLRPLEL